MSDINFSIKITKQIDMVEYFEKLGYRPQKIRNNDYWYLSPLHQEKEASFKVNRKLNVWYDHGIGQGGSIIDFGILYHNCSIKEFLIKMENSFSFHRQILTVQQPLINTQKILKEALEPKIKVIAAKPLANPILCRYLDDRKIPIDIAKKYCREVDFELYTKKYYAIGFENKSGGFELRNQYFKGSSSPKDFTIINQHPDSKSIAVFEGFFSFLSYQTLNQNKALILPDRQTGFLILNSLSLVEKSRNLMEKNQKIYLYLDRDEAGIKHTKEAMKRDIKYVDRSHLYKNDKDLNDYLVRYSLHQKKEHKIKIHF